MCSTNNKTRIFKVQKGRKFTIDYSKTIAIIRKQQGINLELKPKNLESNFKKTGKKI